MSTNFPAALDTLGAAGTLGGPFVDEVPPADPFKNIAADYRTNLNDAMLAVQTRVGLTDDPNSASLSWATISEGGVGNLGLRFAQEQSEWPGAVGESGIFLKDTTFEPMFHRAGEPTSTFYSMLGGGGGSNTLQDTYDASSPAQIAIDSSVPLVFKTKTTGGHFQVYNEAGTNAFLEADEDNSLLTLGDTTSLLLNLSGRVASNIQFDGTSPRSITINNNDLNFTTVGTGDLVLLSAGTLLCTIASTITLNATGDLTASGDEILFSSDTGDISITSKEAIKISTSDTRQTRSLLVGDDDPTSVSKDAEIASLYLRDATTAGELYVKQDNGDTTNWELVGGDTLQSVYDRGNTISNVVDTPVVLSSPAVYRKALIELDQNDEDEPFYHLLGTHNADPVTPLGNLCTANTGTSVIGPLDSTWSFIGMHQVHVTDSLGVIPTGRYWVPLYQAVP